jgi:hypothetical protein
VPEILMIMPLVCFVCIGLHSIDDGLLVNFHGSSEWESLFDINGNVLHQLVVEMQLLNFAQELELRKEDNENEDIQDRGHAQILATLVSIIPFWWI